MNVGNVGGAVAILVVVGALAFGASVLVRRLFPAVASADGGPPSATLSYVAASYGVLVGFVIVFLLGQVASARQAIADEATSVGTAFDEAQLFPEAEPQIQHALICYSRAVTEREWPAMAARSSAPEADAAYRDLIAAYGDADEPTGGTFQPAAATNSFVQVGNISSARATRLMAAQTRLGPLLWGLLLGGAILLLTLLFLLTARAASRAQAAYVALAAMFAAVMLLLVLVLSHPFRDAGRQLSPRPLLENAARMVDLAQPAADRPCPFEVSN